MIYMRGQARGYDSWASATGENEWSWKACLRDFLKHEDSHRLEAAGRVATKDKDGRPVAPDGFHAAGGEWRVERQRLRWEILEAYREAAVQSGVPRSSDFNTGDNEGVGYFEVNQRRGWCLSAAKAFLDPAKARKNTTILTDAMVTRLLFESDNGLR
jgi:choline dehydrogenase